MVAPLSSELGMDVAWAEPGFRSGHRPITNVRGLSGTM